MGQDDPAFLCLVVLLHRVAAASGTFFTRHKPASASPATPSAVGVPLPLAGGFADLTRTSENRHNHSP